MKFEQTRVHRAVQEILQGHPNAWDQLFQLQQDVQRLPQNVLVDIITTLVLKHDSLEDHHTSEVPKLLSYFSEFLPPCNKGPIMNEVLNYISYAKHSDIAELVDLLNVLKDNCSEYLPIFYDRLSSNDDDIDIESRRNDFCSALVTTLTKFKFPPKLSELRETRERVNQVQMFLNFLVDDKNHTRKKHMIVICLKTLYSIISDVSNVQNQEKTLGLVVLRLVNEPEDFFNKYFVSSDHDDASLARALKVLGLNLLWWPGDKINAWVLCLIKHFEAQQKYTILNEFAEEVLPKIFIALSLSAIRTSCSPVIFYILRKQASPKLLNSLTDNIFGAYNALNTSLDKEAKNCLQNLVDIVSALERRFPENAKNMQKLRDLVPPQNNVVYDILNEEIWEIKISEMIDYPIPVRSNIDKVGLTNLGNTCYMNSVLQALLSTKQFCYEVLVKDPGCDGGDHIVLKKLRNLFALLMYSNRNSWAPTEILQACRPAYFLPGQQQDSSEFLCHLLDILHEQEKIMPLQYPSCSTTRSDLKMEEKDCEITPVSDCEPMESVSGIKRWTTEENLSEGGVLQRKTQSLADVTNGEDLSQTQNLSDSHSDSTDSGIQSVDGEDTSQNSLVHRVFGGRSNITYQCTQCNNLSHNTDKFRDLQLCFPEEISENQAVKVQDLINYYFLPENLTGENKYRCDKCTKLCDAQRTIQILQAPSHLILTLKHFRYDSETRLRTKLRHKVIYNDVIKLEVSTPNDGKIHEEYYLYAAVVHSGHSMDYGHYFTYTRGSKNDWYKFNDSYVSQTSFQEFERLEPPDTPYILFYAKANGNEMFEDEKPELVTLSKSVQDLVNEDTAKYKEEVKHRSEKKGRCAKLSTPKLCEDNNPDDDNPPSSSCRDFMNVPNNRCQY